jgi:predicted HicB family RNase H-like nuclease
MCWGTLAPTIRQVKRSFCVYQIKGSFNVRIAPELHERVMIAAKQQGMTLNRFIAEPLSQAVDH